MKPRGRQPDRWHQWRGSRTQRLSAHASEAARGAATACGWLCGATEAWPLCLKMFEGLVGGQKFVGGIAPLQYRKKGYITYRGTHPDHRDRSARLREVPPNRSLKFVRIFRTPVRIFRTCMRNRKGHRAQLWWNCMRGYVSPFFRKKGDYDRCGVRRFRASCAAVSPHSKSSQE